MLELLILLRFQQVREFRRDKDVKASPPKRSLYNLNASAEISNSPSQAIFGKPTRIHTPMHEILGNEYGRKFAEYAQEMQTIDREMVRIKRFIIINSILVLIILYIHRKNCKKSLKGNTYLEIQKLMIWHPVSSSKK